MKKGGKNILMSLLIVVTAIFIAVVAIFFVELNENHETDNHHINVRPSQPITAITSFPESVSPDDPITINWLVDGPEGTVSSHTSIHMKIISSEDNYEHIYKTDENFDLDPDEFTPFISNFADGEYATPHNYQGSMSAPKTPSVLYLISHAVVNGEDYWSDEKKIEVK